MPLPKKGSYAELVAQANANSFIGKEEPTAKVKQSKPPKLIKGVSPRQARLLLELLGGSRFLLSVAGEQYACGRTDVGWVMCALQEDAEERSLNIDASACSCPQNKMHQRVCKHMEALKKFV